MEKLLRIIQTQRHDFLNHLQVVSGLLQLDKVDQAREYIKQVTAEMALFSATTRVKIPEVTAALLGGLHQAAMYQVVLKLTVKSDLGECSLPGPVAGKAIENIFDTAISVVTSPLAEEVYMEMVLEDAGEGYVGRVILPELSSAEIGQMEKDLTVIKNLLQPYQGSVQMITSSKEVVIILFFPGKK